MPRHSWLGFVALTMAIGCDYRTMKIPVDPTFSSLEEITFGPTCVRCHPTLATYDGVMQIVHAGDPAMSRLYQEVEQGSMPQQAPKLSTGEIAAIKEWIVLGAKND